MSGAWSILDSKRINHDLTKPGSLEHPASQSQIGFDLTVQGLQTFTVQASNSYQSCMYMVFDLCLTVCGEDPRVSHLTSWLQCIGDCGMQLKCHECTVEANVA